MASYMYPVFIVIGVLLLPRVMGLLAPFIVGFLIYLLCRKSVRRMAGLGLNRSVASLFALGFVAAVIPGLAAIVFAFAYNESSHLPELYAKLSSIEVKNTLLQKFLSVFREEFTETVKTLSVKLLSYIEDITGFLMIMVFAVLSGFFFLKDEEKIADIVLRIGGDGLRKNIRFFKETISGALSGYIRAQLLLMLLTFTIISVFLILFGIKYALLIALGIAFVDAIPVFGTGCILLPWALYEFLSGGNALGFGLLALYGVCALTRQILEPKILSSQIGLHPLLTLGGVFVGYKLFGFWGLIIGPILTMIFVTYIQKNR